MATLESLGLGSGVLTTDLIDKLIKAERDSTDFRLDNRQELTEAKITAYGEVKSRMSKMQDAAIALSSPTLTGATTATSSDESILSVDTGLGAEPGNYSVEVINTAKAHSLATGAYSSIDDIVGTGKLVFNFGELEYDSNGNVTGQNANATRGTATIEIGDSNRTLAGIRDAINKADIGINASIVNDGTGYRLQLTSAETGKENAFTIDALDASGEPAVGGLSDFSFNENQPNLTQTSKGEDAQLRVNGLTITRASNEVNEVIKGVTLNLHNADVGKTVNINVSPDIEGLTGTLQSFVDAYNDLKEFVDDLSKYDAGAQVGGLLMGDSAIRSMMENLRSMISQPIVGLNGKYRSLTELGINTNKDNKYLLDFDTNVLAKALTESRNDVVGLLSKTGSASDVHITYMNDSVNTKPGSYDVEITQLATQAKYQGNSLALLDFSNPVVIDGSNNKFTINVNGRNAAIELKEGSYATGEELAKQIALQINSSDSLKDFGHSVSVEYNAAEKRFDVTSNLYGSASKISFTSVSSNVANTLGFAATGTGTYKGVELGALGADAFAGLGATTLAGNATVDSSVGIDFATNNATFSLSVNGGAAVDVVVNQKALGVDLNGDGVHGDRNDTLQAIQNAIDATSLNGSVLASFDKSGHLIFTTTEKTANASLEITQVGSTASDTLLGLRDDQGASQNGKDPGVTFGSDVEFKVEVDGLESETKVTVPAGTYATGEDLAAAVQQALQDTLSSDPAFAGGVTGASTATGDRDISAGIDFAAANAGFRLNVNGVEKEIVVNSTGSDSLAEIQDAINAAFGAGVVTASLDDNGGLKLTTDAAGHEQFIEVVSDGRGAQSSSFGSLNDPLDFTGGNNATFTLAVDGVDINVEVNGKGNGGATNLNMIQQSLDAALEQSGQFQAGDVRARMDDSGNLYFETLSKNGTRTAATFGANANLQVKNVDANASSMLGLSDETINNGYDGFGLTTGQRTFGYDLTPEVSYQVNSDTKLGSLNINIGGAGTKVRFSELDSAAISFLGLQDKENYTEKVAQGKDVAGFIDGVEAKGEGLFLRAQMGSEKATNGYYLGNEAWDFSTSLELDASNSKFTVSIDGVEAEVQLNHPASYNSGEALATALQKAINETAAFKDAKVGVKVEYTNDESSYAHKKFSMISASTGEKSEVKITEISTEAANAFGFVTGIGNGEVGKAQVGEDSGAAGIRIQVSGGSLGNRGTVDFVSGFGDQLKNILSGFLNGAQSIIANREFGLDQDLDNIAKDRERLNMRMDAMEARLKSSFQYNDAIVARLNTTLDFVKMQFEAMANSMKK